MLRCTAGFRSTRRTKIICTIGPTSCSEEMLETLAVNGMNVARLNMCHGSREWHHEIIARIRRLNQDKGCACLLHAHLSTRSTFLDVRRWRPASRPLWPWNYCGNRSLTSVRTVLV